MLIDDIIVALTTDRRLNLSKMSRETGVSLSSIYRLRKNQGNSNLSFVKVMKLSEYINKTYGSLREKENG